MNLAELSLRTLWKPLIIGVGLAFLYAAVLEKLVADWWQDENYSHGLLVPIIVIYIVWSEIDYLRRIRSSPCVAGGLTIIVFSLLMLLIGTFGAELFTQRISLVLMLIGVMVYFFGGKILHGLAVPIILLLLSIPIPQIIFNKIAFPLQMWASKMAHWGIGLFGVESSRRGNVIELIPIGHTKAVGLEVVEACSGIRSLMTLAALALILAYFTRDRRQRLTDSWLGAMYTWEFWRIVILMASAIPIALVTNAARVTATGVMTYYYGVDVIRGSLHDIAGWGVFISALVLMIVLNAVLKRFDTRDALTSEFPEPLVEGPSWKISSAQTVVLFITLLCGGVLINWLQNRVEFPPERIGLKEMPGRIGIWEHRGGEVRFDEPTERVLGASDYVMRYYFSSEGHLNFYIGYYASQRTGATYHSPLNCMPGSGWELKDHEFVEIQRSDGGKFKANRYFVENGNQRQIMIYWYEGRGRSTASEYMDKVYTSWDSFVARRSDAAMVRILIPIGNDEEKALGLAVDFASRVADQISAYVPD